MVKVMKDSFWKRKTIRQQLLWLELHCRGPTSKVDPNLPLSYICHYARDILISHRSLFTPFVDYAWSPVRHCHYFVFATYRKSLADILRHEHTCTVTRTQVQDISEQILKAIGCE